MPIAASNIVKIEPRVIGAGASGLDLNGLFIVPAGAETEHIVFPSGVTCYSSAASVKEDFGAYSPTGLFASQYFNGYINKFRSPGGLYIAAWAKTAQAGYVLSAKAPSTLAALKAITAGTMTFKVDGATKTATAINLSTATSMAQVATLVSAGAQGWTLTYNGVTERFMLKSSTAGKASSVDMGNQTPSATNLAYALGLVSTQGALTSSGADVETVTGVIERIRSATQNWVSFTFSEPSDTKADSSTIGEEAAAWAAQNYGYLYIGYSSNAALLTPTANDIVSTLSQYEYTAFVYGDTKYAAFIMGGIASIDWNRFNGTITLAFKSGAGLAATVSNEKDAMTLEGRGVNFYGAYATRNADFDFLYPGVLLSSQYGFIDSLINSIWLNNELQLAILQGLNSAPRIPYTETGYSRIRAWTLDPINRGLNNGTIQAGVVLSEAQKSEVMAEAGLDISGELFTQGYYLQILDPGAAARVARESPVISLWYMYGGAVQRVTVASTAVL